MEEFWNIDVRFGKIKIGSVEKEIRLKVHEFLEEYYLNAEIVEIPNVNYRTHVLGKIYYKDPVYTISISLNPDYSRTGVIGKVESVEKVSEREIEIGRARAFYYDEHRTLILWECYLHKEICKTPLDNNFRTVWRGFEKFIIDKYPANVIFTPSWEPLYDNKEWVEFLESEGYSRYNKLAFFKKIDKS